MIRQSKASMRRADAVRDITAFEAGRASAPAPMAWIEAALMQPLHERERAVVSAAAALVKWKDTTGAVDEIRVEFFTRPVRVVAPPDAADNPLESMRRGEGDVHHFAAPMAGADAPAAAYAPDAEDPPMPVPPPVPEDDGRRTADECAIAAAVLAEACLTAPNIAFKEPVAACALDCRLLAMRTRDPGAKGTLARAADLLARASKAAGTGSGPSLFARSPAQKLVETAVATGAGADEAHAIATFAADYDELAASGCAPSFSRERHVELSMQRWRKEHESP